MMKKKAQYPHNPFGNIRDIIAEDDGSAMKAAILRMGGTEEEANHAASVIAKDSAERVKRSQESSVA